MGEGKPNSAAALHPTVSYRGRTASLASSKEKRQHERHLLKWEGVEGPSQTPSHNNSCIIIFNATQ